MASSKGPSSMRNMMCNAKHSLLPPKSPFPSISPSYIDCVPNPAIAPKSIPRPREGNSHHQRTSSEGFLIEEQPSWLDELLNEPETPVRKGGHRRSSSDSFAYVDMANAANIDYAAQDESLFKNVTSMPLWASQDFDHYKDAQQVSFHSEPNSVGMLKNRTWDSSLNSFAHPSGFPSARDNIVLQNPASLSAPQEVDRVPCMTTEKLDPIESGPHDQKASSEKGENSHSKSSASETDTKRAKQQFAQRSRVRKLQYIAELERNVQTLQAEGSEVSAELEFLNQQNLILSMENKALKQRLENLAQEQLIKYMEHEVLEREIGRLQALYHHHHQQQQQQQQPQRPQQQRQPSSSHRRTNSRDLESQFANLSLKHKDNASSGRDPVSGQLHT